MDGGERVKGGQFTCPYTLCAFLFCPKRTEAIGEVCHKIDGRCICFTVSNRIFRNTSLEILILMQDIVKIKADGHSLLF